MPESRFEEFRRLVLDDVTLQKELRDVTDRLAFIAQVVELGEKNEYEFTSTEVEEAMNAARRDWIERMI